MALTARNRLLCQGKPPAIPGVPALRVRPDLRRPLWLGFAALLIVAIALGAGWWYGAGRFAVAIDEWVAARRAEGFHIEATDRRITGFPLLWTARYASVAIAAPGSPPGWAWQGHAVTVTWSLFDRMAVRIGSRGTSSLDLMIGGKPIAALIDSDGTELRLAPEKSEQHITGEAERVALSMAGLGASAQSLSFSLSFDPAAPADHATVAGSTSLTARQLSVTLPGQAQPALTLSGTLAAALMGRPPAGPLAPAVAAWRDEGGTIELSDIDVSSGNVAMKGNFTLALDGEMRPIGAGTANFRGLDQAIDRLVAAGQMSGRDVPLAKLAFGALARPDAATGVPTLTMPVTAENGFLFIGPIKVARLHPLKLD